MKNLYILTEERPKISVLATILQKFSTDQKPLALSITYASYLS
ncbi:hypothetical protein [Capnocytophaga sputigena]|nr:hypothetical protein [Capnocytophaga sputigena]